MNHSVAGRSPVSKRLGVSVDDRPMQMASLNLVVDKPEWSKVVIDNLATLQVPVGTMSKGRHRISIWRIDDNAVLREVHVSMHGGCGRS